MRVEPLAYTHMREYLSGYRQMRIVARNFMKTVIESRSMKKILKRSKIDYEKHTGQMTTRCAYARKSVIFLVNLGKKAVERLDKRHEGQSYIIYTWSDSIVEKIGEKKLIKKNEQEKKTDQKIEKF